MPIYEYKCTECNYKFEDIRTVDQCSLPALCPKCSFVAEKVPSVFFCITDTNFFYTGKYDSRLGSVVEGRADWDRKLKQKGLHEIPTKDFAVTTTLEERVNKLPEPM